MTTDYDDRTDRGLNPLPQPPSMTRSLEEARRRLGPAAQARTESGKPSHDVSMARARAMTAEYDALHPTRNVVEDRASRGTLTQLAIALAKAGYTDRAAAIAYCSEVIGRVIASRKELTKAEASLILDRLKGVVPNGDGS